MDLGDHGAVLGGLPEVAPIFGLVGGGAKRQDEAPVVDRLPAESCDGSAVRGGGTSRSTR